MSQKPVLVIMAAGMGSRYGGLKQIDPVDREGDLIIDFSIFDAVEAGFEKVVFIIKKSIEKEFKEHIGNRMEKHVQVEYVYQENNRLPDGFEVPEGRVKPWGTGHAILCCSEVIDGPFAVMITMENRRSRRSMIVWHPAVMMANISMRWLPIISTTH